MWGDWHLLRYVEFSFPEFTILYLVDLLSANKHDIYSSQLSQAFPPLTMLLQLHHSRAAGVSTLYKHLLKQPEALSKNLVSILVLLTLWSTVSQLLGFPSDSGVKNPPAVQKLQEPWVQSLGGEDPVEEGMATQPSILAWRSHGEESGSLKSMGTERVGHDRSDLARNTHPRFQLQSRHTCVKVLTSSESP